MIHSPLRVFVLKNCYDYVLSENIAGNLTQANATLKENLKTWLLNYKMVNDL